MKALLATAVEHCLAGQPLSERQRHGVR